MSEKLEMTEPQSDVILAENEYVAAVAGFAAGKTKAASVLAVSRKFQYPTIDVAYLAPTYSLIKSIFFPFVTDLLISTGLKPKRDFHINKTDHEILIQGCGKIICKSMTDPDMIVGWESGDAIMDEFDLLPIAKAHVAMLKVSARCRQKFPDGKKNQKYVTTTPEGFKATYQLFKKDPLEDSRLIQMSTYSNAINLPKGYIESRKAQYPDQLIEAYIEGKFVNLTTGSVYPNFNRKTHNVNVVAADNEPLHIGMDFNVYKMYAGVHVIRDKKSFLVDEFSGVEDTPRMIELIDQRYPNRSIIIYPDASGNSKSSKGASISDITMLRAAGYMISAPASNPLVRNRVNSFNSRLMDRNGVINYYVNTEKCPIATTSLEQQTYDTNGQPNKKEDHDHPNDANGYFVHRMWPLLTNVQETIEVNMTQDMDYSLDNSDLELGGSYDY